jgi:multiple sugar transport system substrate-binding protein
MKKTIALVAALLCSTASSALSAELTIWVPAIYSPATGLAEGAQLYQELYAEFEAANPGITIKYEVIDSSAVGLQQILTAANAGNMPDVAIVDGQWVGRLVESDLLVGLNKYWPAEDQADFHPAAMASQVIDGEAYAVMFQTGMRGMIYRPSTLSSVGVESFPTTWDGLLDLAEKLKATASSPVMLPGKAANEPAMIYLLSIFWGLGGQVVDADGSPIIFEGENAAKLEQTLSLFKQLVDNGAMTTEVSVLDEVGMRPYFYGGDAAIVGQSSTAIRTIWTEMPDTKGDLAVAAIPLPEGVAPVTVVGGYSYAITTKDPAEQDAAWKFISFMTEPGNLGRTNETLGQLPLRNSIWETNEFFLNDPVMKGFRELYLRESRVRPSVPIYQAISSAVTTELSSVLIGQVTPAEAVQRARDVVMVEYERQKLR